MSAKGVLVYYALNFMCMNNLADLKKIITLIVFILLLLLFEGTTGWVRKFYMQFDIIVMFIKYIIPPNVRTEIIKN